MFVLLLAGLVTELIAQTFQNRVKLKSKLQKIKKFPRSMIRKIQNVKRNIRQKVAPSTDHPTSDPNYSNDNMIESQNGNEMHTKVGIISKPMRSTSPINSSILDDETCVVREVSELHQEKIVTVAEVFNSKEASTSQGEHEP